MTILESTGDLHPEPELRLIDLRGRELTLTQIRAVLPRLGGQDTAAVEASARRTVEAVRDRGWPAVQEFTERFDGISQQQPRVPREALSQALADLPQQVRSGLEEAIRRARHVAQAQRPRSVTTEVAPGASVTLRWEAVHRVGLYIPGGRAVYPSSVVMNAVPAQAAGVSSLALCSPPQREHGGLPHPSILAAAELLGITEVYALGGGQAIAAMAYGLEGSGDFAGLEAVEMISGPGNNFVAAAKRLVNGQVGIDAEAGATEIAVLADAKAPADFIAADLISQAEHDPQAAAVLVTDSPQLIAEVRAQLREQVAATAHRQRVLAALSGAQSAILLVDSLDAGLEVVNAYAAEHLEILTQDAPAVARRVQNAGAIFIGPSAPVSLGDYCAGSNHVLPTGGTAAFASGLSVFSFLKAIQEIDYDAKALAEVTGHIVSLAQAENLPAHGDAVTIRSIRIEPKHNI